MRMNAKSSLQQPLVAALVILFLTAIPLNSSALAEGRECLKHDIAGELCLEGSRNTGITRIRIETPCLKGKPDRKRVRGFMEVWSKCDKGECSWGRVRARMRWNDDQGQLVRAVGRYEADEGRKRVIVRRKDSDDYRVRIRIKGEDRGDKKNRRRADRAAHCAS